MKDLMAKMNFPEEELSAYRIRMKLGLPTYTTRVSAERSKYHVGQVVGSPFGKIHIEEVRTFSAETPHPFDKELTPHQRHQIQGAFDVIRFSAREK